MAPTDSELLSTLPDTFRYSDGLGQISERQLRRLIDNGSVTAFARGLYRKSGWLGEEDLVEIAAKAPRATLCLRSALARHQLIDDIPAEIDIAIPRGSWAPKTAVPVRWRRFELATFDLGRTVLDIDSGHGIGLYSAQRSIIDAFRMRHIDGSDLAYEALRRWLRQGGQPSELLSLALAFPRAFPALRQSLEVLL